MKTKNQSLAVGFAAVLLAAIRATALPPTCAVANKTFIPTDGVWQTPGNWNQGVLPGFGDTVCIPLGKTARIVEGFCNGGANHGDPCTTCPQSTCNNTTGVCNGGPMMGVACCPNGTCPGPIVLQIAGIVVEGGAQLRLYPNVNLQVSGDSDFIGTFSIDGDGLDNHTNALQFATPGTSVWLRTDVTMNGEVNLENPSTLYIDGDLTIAGDGAGLRGDCDPLDCAFSSRIEPARFCNGGETPGKTCETGADCPNGSCDAGQASLRIATAPGGVSTIRARSLLLRERWIVNLDFINDAFVVADISEAGANETGTIQFTGPSLSGTGQYIAEKRAFPSTFDPGSILIDTVLHIAGPDWDFANWSTAGGGRILLGPNAVFDNLTGDLTVGLDVRLDQPDFIVPADLHVTRPFEINAANFAVGGDTFVTGGPLTFNVDCTVGQLFMTSAGNMIVEQGHIVTFDAR